MAAPGVALVLLLFSLLVAILGFRLLVASWVQQGAVAQRSALEDVERRAARWTSRLDAWLRRTALGNELWTKLASAGLGLRLVDVVIVGAAICVITFLLADTIFPPWMAFLAAALAARGCWAYVERHRAKRREAFIAQLPELARILSNASSAGLAIRTAIEMAAAELDDPAASETRMVAEELRLGQSLDRALANLERRMPSRDVGVLISTLVIQQRSGGDLVRALYDMAATLEARRDLRREVRTVMAGSIFTGYLVAFMGLATVLLLNLANPGVIERMTSSFWGQVAFLVAASLYGFGFLLVRRVTRIDI